MGSNRFIVLVLSLGMVGLCGFVTAGFVAIGHIGYAGVVAVFGVGGWSTLARAAWRDE